MAAGVGLKIEVRGAEVDALLDRFMAGLTDLTPLNEHVGLRGAEVTRSHLVSIAQTRHKTAEDLKATPSGHWAQAAEKTSHRADADGAIVSINHPGIGRAGHDVTIKPGPGKKYLTIPAIAEAYNQRAYRVSGLEVIYRWMQESDFSPLVGTGRAIPIGLGKKEGKGKERTETIWYWLVRGVTQRQDRTLLPSDEEYRLAALAGVRDFVDRVLAA